MLDGGEPPLGVDAPGERLRPLAPVRVAVPGPPTARTPLLDVCHPTPFLPVQGSLRMARRHRTKQESLASCQHMEPNPGHRWVLTPRMAALVVDKVIARHRLFGD